MDYWASNTGDAMDTNFCELKLQCMKLKMHESVHFAVHRALKCQQQFEQVKHGTLSLLRHLRCVVDLMGFSVNCADLADKSIDCQISYILIGNVGTPEMEMFIPWICKGHQVVSSILS